MTDTEQIQEAFDELLYALRKDTSEGSKEKIREAFEFAAKAHSGVRRKSGEPYIMHPLGVAMIAVKELGLGKTSAIAALLHDVVEDTDYTVEDISNLFGPKIATIVDGLTKITGVMDKDTSQQAESFRKMILTLSDDVRVILVKIADRLHNMRTLASMPEHKRVKIASETLYVYAPLTHRMGLYAIKSELEDLSMKYQHPAEYSFIEKEILKYREQKACIFEMFTQPIKERLDNHGYTYTLTARTKSVYSVWNKMQSRNINVDEIYDLLAVRIIFEPKDEKLEKLNCWDIYTLITELYKPKLDRIRDWISIPKANGYEALHLTVMGPQGQWFEVQIRSNRMNEVAEKGLAAHWKYKGDSEYSELDKWLSSIKEVLEQPNTTALEFLDDFRLNLFVNEIRVFTPKGAMITLPQGATVLDFAYEIHTHIGSTCIGAKVNHKLVAMSHVLKGGDQIEVLTTETQRPNLDWLNFINTTKARTNIQFALRKERKEMITMGRNIFSTAVTKFNVPVTDEILDKLLVHYNLITRDDLFVELGRGVISSVDLEKNVQKRIENRFIRYWKLQFQLGPKKQRKVKNTDDLVNKLSRKNNDDIDFQTASCCNPIPGDDVVAFDLDKDNITIHKRSCANAVRLMASFGNKIVPVEWVSHTKMSFLAEIKISGIDKTGIVGDIVAKISKEAKIRMKIVHFEANDGIFEGLIKLYVYNTSDLSKLISKLMKLDGIKNVQRMETEEN